MPYRVAFLFLGENLGGLCWKAWKAFSNFWEFWVHSRWQNTRIQTPRIQNTGRFRRLNSFQTFRSRGQHLCSKFAKSPHVGCARTFKVSTSPHGRLSLRQNIDSWINLTLENDYEFYF